MIRHGERNITKCLPKTPTPAHPSMLQYLVQGEATTFMRERQLKIQGQVKTNMYTQNVPSKISVVFSSLFRHLAKAGYVVEKPHQLGRREVRRDG